MYATFQKSTGVVLALACAAILGGCAAVGPDYQGPPSVELPPTWHQKVNQSTDLSMDLSPWWKHFNDPMLSVLIDQAGEDNLDLRMALSRIRAAQSQYGIAASANLPTINAAGSASRQKDSKNQLPGFPARIADYESVTSSMRWEIDLFGRIERQNEAAQAAVEASVEQYRDVLVMLNARIAGTYIEVRTLQQRLALAHKNVANQQETVRLVKARFKAELTSELDVHRAKQNLASSQSAIPLLNAGLSRAINRLAVLLAQPPGKLNIQLQQPQPIPKFSNHLVVQVPADVMRQRPDIRIAERQLAAQTAQIGVAEADLYPRLSLSGLFGFSTSTGSLASSRSNLWSFGPDLSWQLFDGGRVRNRIALENAKAEQARASYEKTVLLALEEVEAGLIDYHQEVERQVFLNQSVTQAQKSVSIARVQFKSGLSNFQTVLDAERVLFAEEDKLAASQGALANHLVGIYRAMGGGWDSVKNLTGEE